MIFKMPAENKIGEGNTNGISEDRLKKILIVSDKGQDLSLPENYFSESCTIRKAENGLEALKLLQHNFSPDIIISDYIMPHFDGKALLSYLKNNIMYKDIPVIVISDVPGYETMVEIVNCGAQGYFLIPYNVKELCNLVNSILETK